MKLPPILESQMEKDTENNMDTSGPFEGRYMDCLGIDRNKYIYIYIELLPL